MGDDVIGKPFSVTLGCRPLAKEEGKWKRKEGLAELSAQEKETNGDLLMANQISRFLSP